MTSSKNGLGWACLMYHDVYPQASQAGGGPQRFSVSTRSFIQMLDTIHALGQRGCSVSDLLERKGSAGSDVAITFDDGTISQFEHAFPELVRRGMTASFFVVTDWVGKPGYMTWEQLRVMADAGMSIQSHTKSHTLLSSLGAEDVREELTGSKGLLDDHMGQETVVISLPGGDAPKRGLRDLFSSSGYRTVAHSRWGLNGSLAGTSSDRVAWIRRCTVPAELDRELAERILSGDRRLDAMRRVREFGLNAVRSGLGANRYASYRKWVLDRLDAS